MKRAFKTEIKLTTEQRHKIHLTFGVCRFLYNHFLAYNKDHYVQFKEGNKDYGYVSGFDFDKYVNNDLSKQDGYEWIKGVSSKARKKAIMNAHNSYQRFFTGKSKFPRFKKKGRQDVKAYFPKSNVTDWTIERHRVKIPTIGWVRLKEFGYIPTDQRVISGTVSQKADRYYVSVLCEVEGYASNYDLYDRGVGIDLGIKTFAFTSDNEEFKNINKTKRVRLLEKRLKREQRSLSRKYEGLKKLDSEIEESKSHYNHSNINKNRLRVQKLHQRLANIRLEYVKSVVNALVKTKPSYITIEDLNVREMMQNRHLSKAIAKQCFYTFKKWLVVKCKQYGIELRQVDRFYPSSKLCSCCGKKNSNLKLKDRVFDCDCGLVIDRDYNASLNLLQAKEYTLLT